MNTNNATIDLVVSEEVIGSLRTQIAKEYFVGNDIRAAALTTLYMGMISTPRGSYGATYDGE